MRGARLSGLRLIWLGGALAGGARGAAAAPGYTPDISVALQGCLAGAGCHATVNPPMATYNDAKLNIDQIISAVTAPQGGPQFMPQGGQALDPTTIQKFRDWKTAGFPQTATTTTATSTFPGFGTGTGTATYTPFGRNGPPTGNRPGTTTNPGATGGNPTPLVLDLSGDRRLSLGRTAAFDLYGTGEPLRLSWPGAGFGFLVLPETASGCPRTGAELFGDATPLGDAPGQTAPDGFAALAQYDRAGAGVIDQRNPVFARLRVWVDRRGDGRCTPDEVLPLAAYHITALHLDYARARFRSSAASEPVPLLIGSYDVLLPDGRLASRLLADVYLTILGGEP